MRPDLLGVYGWVFAAAGLVFVAGGGALTAWLSRAGRLLPGARDMAGEGPSLWLGLTGSLMAVISYLAFSLRRDPRQPPAWNALLLSKAVSAALFAAFAAAGRNTLFLVGAVVDGAILAHLWALRRALAAPPLLEARAPGSAGPFYEAWFAKLNDPATGDALWVRYTVSRPASGPETAACWFVLYDKAGGRVRRARWEAPLSELRWGEGCPFELGESSVTPGRLRGRHGGVSWDLAWEEAKAPPFGFVPALLSGLGLAGSEYVAPVSLARFSGEASVDGDLRRFVGAPGSLGHLWGGRMADNWSWTHAAFEGLEGGPSVFELLSAQVRAGPFLLPRLTCAHLWHGGRHYRSVGVWKGLRNRSRRRGEGWEFRVDFGDLVAQGECRPEAGLTADLEYESPEGRRLLCRNSKTGTLRMSLMRSDGEPVAALENEGAAAVEFVEGLPC